MKNYLIKHKEIIVTSLIILATISQFTHNVVSQKIDSAKDLIFDREIGVVSGAAALAANSADIILQRDLLQSCKTNNLNICGGAEVLLNQAAMVHDSIRASAYESPEYLKEAIKNYDDIASESRLMFFLTSILFYIFMISAISANIFLKTDKTSG